MRAAFYRLEASYDTPSAEFVGLGNLPKSIHNARVGETLFSKDGYGMCIITEWFSAKGEEAISWDTVARGPQCESKPRRLRIIRKTT